MSGIIFFFVCQTLWISRRSLLQPLPQFAFWSDQKAQRHVKEKARSDFQWTFTDGETKANDSGEGETHQSGDAKPIECEEKPSAISERHSQSVHEQTNQSKLAPRNQVRTNQKSLNMANSWKQGDRDESSNSTCSRETCAGGEHKDRFSEHEAQEVWNHNRLLNICKGSNEDQCIDMGIVHVFVNESIRSPWTWLSRQFGSLHETQTSRKFRVYSMSHRNRYKNILKIFWMCLTIESTYLSWTEIDIVSWSTDSVDKQKYVYSDSDLCLVKVWAQKECNCKMGRSSWRIQNVRFLLRMAGNRWRKQLNSSGIFSKDSRHCRFFSKTKMDLPERNIENQKFTDRFVCMSTFNDTDWTTKRNDEICSWNSDKVRPDRFPSLFGSGLVIYTFRFSLGRDRSCPVANCISKYSFLMYFHFIQPTKFLTINPSRCSGSFHSSACMCPQLCDAQDAVCGADCGADAAFQKKLHFSFTLILSLTFVLCDVWPLRRRSVSLHWRTSLVCFEHFCGTRLTFVSFLCSHTVIVFE